jgi:tRNA/tmRNA/rRNA uracil-C5-methylase (TrmA/RlmC/RlmD family)
MTETTTPEALVRLERAVAGGVVLGHEVAGSGVAGSGVAGSGRVVLLEGGLPGESVVARLTSSRRTLARGWVERVVEASPGRVEEPCPRVAQGCGGCDLQHALPEVQREMKVEVVRDALRHLARVDGRGPGAPAVLAGPAVPDTGYRTTMRVAVDDEGRPGLRHRRSHDVVPVGGCLVAHRLLAPVLAEGRFPGASEVTVRASVADGEVMAVIDGPGATRAAAAAAEAEVPDGVRVLSGKDLAGGRRAWLHEEVDGHRLRLSARSFFQSGPAAAAALAGAVARALGVGGPSGFDPAAHRLVDLYGGVGLFTVALGARRSRVVERSPSAVADARVNTEALGAAVARVDARRWRPSPADFVVADPARSGLGAEVADAVAATGARGVALVSCDPAALARDVALLAERGYRARRIEVVDVFPHTHHVEAVTTLARVAR